MALMRWKKPSSEMATNNSDFFTSLQKDINDLFNNFWLDSNTGGKQLNRFANWSPLVDFKETEKEFILRADLPGMEKSDVHVSLDEGMLTIKGERKYEEKKEKDRIHYNERFYGAFERSFNIPEKQINKDDICAKFENGVLSVTLPKKPEALQETRRIEIK